MSALTKYQKAQRAALFREAAQKIQSCGDPVDAAAFIAGLDSVADTLGALEVPDWMREFVCGDPIECVNRLNREADRLSR